MRATRATVANSISSQMGDETLAKRLVESWIQIQDIFSTIPARSRRKISAELSKLGPHVVPVSGNPLWTDLGAYIKSRRRILGISQLSLAKSLGFTSQFLGRIESGKAPIPDDALRKVVRVLSLDERKMGKIYADAALHFVHSVFSNNRRG